MVWAGDSAAWVALVLSVLGARVLGLGPSFSFRVRPMFMAAALRKFLNLTIQSLWRINAAEDASRTTR